MTKTSTKEKLMKKTAVHTRTMLIHAYMSSTLELMDCLAKYRANFSNMTHFLLLNLRDKLASKCNYSFYFLYSLYRLKQQIVMILSSPRD